MRGRDTHGVDYVLEAKQRDVQILDGSGRGQWVGLEDESGLEFPGNCRTDEAEHQKQDQGGQAIGALGRSLLDGVVLCWVRVGGPCGVVFHVFNVSRSHRRAGLCEGLCGKKRRENYSDVLQMPG